MAKNNQDNNKSQLAGVVVGLAVAAALVVTGAVMWKFISDRKTEAPAESEENSTEEAD